MDKGGDRPPLRGRVDQRAGSHELRDRYPEYVRTGLGRWPDRSTGDRSLDDPRGRAETLSAPCGGLHAIDEHFARASFRCNWTVLLGLLGDLVRDFFGVETVAMPLQRDRNGFCLPSAAGHGVHERVTRQGGRLMTVPVRRTGRAGYQRPAQLLPADPPGDEGDSTRRIAFGSRRVTETSMNLFVPRTCSLRRRRSLSRTHRGRGACERHSRRDGAATG